jgi:hypothetical protein
MNVYDQAADMAHRADELAIMLLRERSHELHRIGVVLRDLSLTNRASVDGAVGRDAQAIVASN